MTGAADRISATFEGKLGAFSLDLAFDAPMRGVTALFGASGSGKTTILRCIAGLERIAGRLQVDGTVWQDSARGTFVMPHRRSVGYVFQEASLFAHLSVRENLLYGAKRTRPGDRNRSITLPDVSDLLGLGDLLERAPGSLSGGERQRVAVGRALLSRPRLLLMDEPLAALDRTAKEEILPYLESLRDMLSIPMLYVSHDIAEVSRLADHMVVIDRGRKVTDGPVAGILERLDLRPATGRFEAGVVLAARVAGHDTDFRLTSLDLNGQTLVIPLADLAVGSEIRLRVRARDVALATERPSGISVRNILEGTVAEIVEEPDTAFAESLIDVRGAGLRCRLTRASVADLGLAPGRPVFALIKTITFDRRSFAVAGRGGDPAT